MTKTGNEPRPQSRKTRRAKRAEDQPSVDEALNQSFQDYENEKIPDRLTRLAKKLDSEIAKVVRKKSH